MFFFFDDNNLPANAGTPSNIDYSESLFESIKHIDDNGNEFWYARELSKVLEYKDFRNFELTIYKAMDACENSNNLVADHFGEVTEMVPIGSGAQRGFRSYKLSRYACYLTVMNGDVWAHCISVSAPMSRMSCLLTRRSVCSWTMPRVMESWSRRTPCLWRVSPGVM